MIQNNSQQFITKDSLSIAKMFSYKGLKHCKFKQKRNKAEQIIKKIILGKEIKQNKLTKKSF